MLNEADGWKNLYFENTIEYVTLVTNKIMESIKLANKYKQTIQCLVVSLGAIVYVQYMEFCGSIMIEFRFSTSILMLEWNFPMEEPPSERVNYIIPNEHIHDRFVVYMGSSIVFVQTATC